MLAYALACAVPTLGVRAPPGPADPATDVTGDTGAAPPDPTTPWTTGPTGPCPPEMALAGDACVDRWEAALLGWSPFEVPDEGVATSEPDTVPQGYISGDVAADACAAAGKRLCTLDEWLRACEGPDGTLYPYGDAYDPFACNDTRDEHPVVELFGADADFSSEQMNDPLLNQLPDSLAFTGEFEDCVSADGVFDLHGNLHEWIDDPYGTFKGGFYVDAVLNGPGCSYTTTAHSTDYHDYSTGFRCCRDPE